jgi:hypothetical protein
MISIAGDTLTWKHSFSVMLIYHIICYSCESFTLLGIHLSIVFLKLEKLTHKLLIFRLHHIFFALIPGSDSCPESLLFLLMLLHRNLISLYKVSFKLHLHILNGLVLVHRSGICLRLIHWVCFFMELFQVFCDLPKRFFKTSIKFFLVLSKEL